MIRQAGPGSMLSGYLLFGFAPVFVRLARDYGWWVSHTLLARFGLALAAVLALTAWARRRGEGWGFTYMFFNFICDDHFMTGIC